MASEGMRLPPGFEKKIESVVVDEPLIVPERLLQLLNATRRRVKAIMIITRFMAALLFLAVIIVSNTRNVQLQGDALLFMLACFVMLFLLLFTSLGMAQYVSGLTDFLHDSSSMHLIAMLKSYRSMWIKLGLSLLLIMIFSAISAAKVLL